MNYFTADLHLGTDEILLRENRPFANINEFSNFCLNQWNKILMDKDVLWILGDFFNYNKNSKLTNNELINTLSFIAKLNCKTILIIGNGEERIMKELFGDKFGLFRFFCIDHGLYDVKSEAIIEMRGKLFYLNHFPHKHKNNMLNLFGHTHRTTGLWKPYGLNVGCDLNHFLLFSETEIFRLLEMKEKYWDNDIDIVDA